MLKETLKFYTSFLSDLGFKIEEDSSISKYVRNSSGVSYVPVKIEGHPLVLGTEKWLNGEDTNNIIYHPLTEDALKGESATIKITKDQAVAILRTRLVNTLLGLGTALVEKAGDTVSPKQVKLFNQNPDFDANALRMLSELLSRGKSSTVSRHILGIYLNSKGAKFDGHDVKRLATVSSTLYGQLDIGEKEVWGYKRMTKKGQIAIKQLFDTVLPNLNGNEYSHGSNNKTAPYFDSIANAYINVSYQLDSIDKACESLYKDELAITPKYEWVGDMKLIPKLAMPIPPLRGNIGNEIIGKAAFSVPSNSNVSINEAGPGPGAVAKTNASSTSSVPAERASVEAERPSHPMFRKNDYPVHNHIPPANPYPTTPSAVIPQRDSTVHPIMARQQHHQPQHGNGVGQFNTGPSGYNPNQHMGNGVGQFNTGNSGYNAYNNQSNNMGYNQNQGRVGQFNAGPSNHNGGAFS